MKAMRVDYIPKLLSALQLTKRCTSLIFRIISCLRPDDNQNDNIQSFMLKKNLLLTDTTPLHIYLNLNFVNKKSTSYHREGLVY